MLAAFLWLLTVQGLGVVALPLTVRAFGGFPDRGYGLGRIVGIVTVGWLAYLTGMLGFTAYVGPTVLILGLLLGAVLWWNWGQDVIAELRPRASLLLAEEVIFLSILGLGLFVRAYNADILGQEKFMDFAFMNALLRSSVLPPEDMWLSGFSMPYYYLGYLLLGLPAKIAGTPGPMAYNLAVTLVFASGFCASVSIVYALVSRLPVTPTLPLVSDLDAEQPADEALPASQTQETPNAEPDPVDVEPWARGEREGAHQPRAAQTPSATWASGDELRLAGAPVTVIEIEVELAELDVEPEPGEEDVTDDEPRVAQEPATEPPRLSPNKAALTFGVLGGALTMLAGNLVAVFELIAARGWGPPELWSAVGVKGLQPAVSSGILPADVGWWWRSSRVIPNIEPDGITEFPYFSFILGDLHPHYMAIPFVLLVVALAANRFLEDRPRPALPSLALAGLALATLLPASTWDVPAFWGLYVLATLADAWRRDPSTEGLKSRLPELLGPLGVGVMLVLPYLLGYQSQPLGLATVEQRTPLVSMLILFGPALLVCLTFALWLMFTHRAAGSAAPRAMLAIGVVVLALSAVGESTLAILVAVLASLAAAGWCRIGSPGRDHDLATQFCWLLATWALCILVGTELIYLRDVFASRMNTVFKFQYQAWLMLGVGGATALGILWTRGGSRAWKPLAALVAAVVLLPGMIYPLGATWSKSNAFRGDPTLMGDRFLERSAPADYRAIEWLRQNAIGRPVVVEAVGGDYTEHARVSTFSGLPTLIGWVGHELQWRGQRPELGTRQQAVDAIYRANSREDLERAAGNLRIRYVFFGTLERAKYGPETQARLDQLMTVVYSRNGTSIYLMPGAQP